MIHITLKSVLLGRRIAATAAKKRSQYISYRRPGGLPCNGFHKMMKSFYEEIVLFLLIFRNIPSISGSCFNPAILEHPCATHPGFLDPTLHPAAMVKVVDSLCF